MKRVLITGMSGTGKSTLICELAARGYKAVDLDSDEWSEWVAIESGHSLEPSGSGSIWETNDWVWREDRVERLLLMDVGEILFVSGTAANQGRFHRYFESIILLSAPVDVIKERLAARTSNVYGKDPADLDRVLRQIETIEPLLRLAASLEVDTSARLDQVVETVLATARASGGA